MVIHHVDDAPHPQLVNVVHQALKILQSAILVWTAQAALSVHLSDGVNGHQPDDVRSQVSDAPQVPAHPLKGALGAVIAHKNGIHDLISTGFTGAFRHIDPPLKPHHIKISRFSLDGNPYFQKKPGPIQVRAFHPNPAPGKRPAAFWCRGAGDGRRSYPHPPPPRSRRPSSPPPGRRAGIPPPDRGR